MGLRKSTFTSANFTNATSKGVMLALRLSDREWTSTVRVAENITPELLSPVLLMEHLLYCRDETERN